MSVNEVEWVMETHLQKAFDELADLITAGKLTFEEVRERLLLAYDSEFADWFEDWWDEVDM